MRTQRPASDLGPTLVGYSEQLRAFARLQLQGDLLGKVDLSGVVQLTLLEAFLARDSFPDEAAAQIAWLRRAVANNLIDELRKLGCRQRDPARECSLDQALDSSSAGIANFLAHDDSTPSAHLAHDEQLGRLAAAIRQLPADQRLAIEMHHLQGVSLIDVGAQLGRSREAVAGLVFRGLKRLRALLADQGEHDLVRVD